MPQSGNGGIYHEGAPDTEWGRGYAFWKVAAPAPRCPPAPPAPFLAGARLRLPSAWLLQSVPSVAPFTSTRAQLPDE